MVNFSIIFLCLIAGFLCKKSTRFPAETPRALNSFILFVSFPALAFSQIPKFYFSSTHQGHWLALVSMAWLSFILSFVFFNYLGKKLQWSERKIGALILTAGLGNTSYVGFPLLEALIGPEAVPVGMVVDQAGSFLVLSFLGISTAAIFSGQKVGPLILIKRVLTFPTFVSLMIVLFLCFLFGQEHLNYFEIAKPVADKIAGTLTPLAMFSVAFQINLDTAVIKKRWKPIVLGLSFKLFFLPIFFYVLYHKIFGITGIELDVVILESAMASMITAAIVANDFNLDSEIANLMVGISIPLSLLTVYLWKVFLS